MRYKFFFVLFIVNICSVLSRDKIRDHYLINSDEAKIRRDPLTFYIIFKRAI